jgi:NmrA-like family
VNPAYIESDTMSQTTIAIAGFTGRFAHLITEYLLSKPGVTIHGICRDTSKVSSETVSNPHVRLFTADSTDTEALRKALVGASVCICCYLGPNELMVDGQQTLIDACIAENVPRYIASDYSFDYRGLKLGDFPYKDFTLLIRDYLVEKGQAGSRGGIRGVHVINGAFTEVLFSPFLGMYQAGGENPSTFGYWGTGDEKWDMATLDDAAAFVAEAACDDTATGFLRGESRYPWRFMGYR